MLLVAIGLLGRSDERPALNAKCENRMAAADSRTILDMPSVYGVPVMHLGVVRMHVGEGQTIDTEVMVMRMQRCSYLIDHQQQHQDQSRHPCECAHDSVRWRSVHRGCRGWRLLDCRRHVPAIFTRNSFTEFRNTRTSGPRWMKAA